MANYREQDPLLQSSINSNSYNTNPSDGYENRYNYRSSQEIGDSRRYDRKRAFHILPGVLILILVLIERIAYYSLTGNLYLFLHEHKFHWTYYNAISALFLFTGVSYLSSLLGGWVSDAFLGRFKTIGIAFIFFSVAYWLLSSVTFNAGFCPPEPWMNLTCPTCTNKDISLFSENCAWPVMSILIFAAIGTGVVKANITPFGAEQVKHTGPDGLKIYLNWLYWCVNIGALVAILGITYIQQEKGFLTGYIIPAGLLTGATVIFWLSYSLYSRQSPSGSSISRIFYVVKEAWKSRRRFAVEELSSRSVNKPDWLDMAKVRYGGIFHESVVEDVKSLSAIMKVFIILIPYWMLYFQMQSTFLAQGLQMRLSLVSSNSSASLEEQILKKGEKFTIPAAWLMLFNVVFLIIFIPLLNHLIYPCLSRYGIHVSMLTRMGIGMVCAASSMLIAGCLELCRLHFIQENKIVNQTIESTTFVAADLSILWQIPQYSLIGISEVFTSVSGMEFACSQAPSRMQGAVMGFYYFCAGIGSFLGVAALKGFEQMFDVLINNPSADINNGKIYYYFFFLASIQLVTVIIFICVSKALKIRRLPSPNRSVTDLSNTT